MILHVQFMTTQTIMIFHQREDRPEDMIERSKSTLIKFAAFQFLSLQQIAKIVRLSSMKVLPRIQAQQIKSTSKR